MTKLIHTQRVRPHAGAGVLSILVLAVLAARPIAVAGTPTPQDVLAGAPTYVLGSAIYTYHGGRWWTRPAASAHASYVELRGPVPAELERRRSLWQANRASQNRWGDYSWAYCPSPAYTTRVDGFS